MLDNQPSLETLQAQDELWQRRQLQLARLTTPAILVGAAVALWLYAAVEVATAVIAYGLRVWPMRRTRMARHHRRLIEARAHRLLVWLAVVAWTVRHLSYLGLWEPTMTVAGELLTARIQVGSFGTSAADVLAFVLTLWLAQPPHPGPLP